MHDFSPTAESVLNPRQLVHPVDVSSTPASPGIYAWWFRRGALDVPEAPYQRSGEYELLYTGISPRKPSTTGKASAGNLRSRLVTHARGDASRSTLRRTLGVLLAEELGLTLGIYRDREHYGPDGETLITQWIRENARVAWATDPQPWVAESELLAHSVLALNIEGRPDAFARSISVRRRDALRIARSTEAT